MAKNEELTDEEKDMRSQAYMDALQGSIDKAFGTLEGGGKKLEVKNLSTESGKIQFRICCIPVITAWPVIRVVLKSFMTSVPTGSGT